MPIGDNRLRSDDESLMTDEQGYYRVSVRPDSWSYGIFHCPEGCEAVKPGKEVDIDTPLGKEKVEHTFYVRKK